MVFEAHFVALAYGVAQMLLDTRRHFHVSLNFIHREMRGNVSDGLTKKNREKRENHSAVLSYTAAQSEDETTSLIIPK